MHKKTWYALGLATLLGGATALEAQTTYVSADAEPSASAIPVYRIPADPMGVRQAVAQQPAPATPEPATTPGETILRPSDTVPEQGEEPKLGPTLPEDVKLFENIFGDWHRGCGPSCRLYGWLDAGYTYASTGHGLLTVEPRENRFGNEFLLNQAAIVLDKPLDPNQLSFGFNATFYAGADAALLRPEGGFTTTDPRFGADFRQLYVSAHLPVLTEGGVDVRAGRMGTIIGYESALAPYSRRTG